MTTYQKFKKLNIRHSAIGLEQSDTDVTYYCTPRDAAIIGWAGVDGIHYCTIPEFGEMIFAVSPMNFGDCVHPIAHSFEDLLRLLLSCGSMDALEQCYAWDEEQFKAFLIDCPATEEQQSVLDVLRTEFRLVPLEDAFAYVKKLQAEFDLSQIPYTEEYYDPDMNAAAPVRAEEWKVTYDGGFWRNEGNAGIEIPIQKSFCWGEEKWYIPAVYICDKGLVIDYCKQADPVQVKAFIDKWDLLNEGNNHYTKEQQEQIEREHPLHTSFKGRVTLNGYKLQSDHSCGLPWIPESCLADGLRRETEAIQIMEHYGLDVSLAWYILGIIISILGISNMKGNISSLHWYHRQRVSPDDVMPFGKRVGLGTLIIGIAIIVFGLFSLITYLTEIEVYTIIGAALLIPAVIVGLGLSLYAIIKYNKGLF